ncbi:class I SAM-dependent methyltransferase [Amycolatopsis sp. RTGN1]|uniref:class I SAM-dependent methyltransferase n=1 Tax=Amycolatopsis ponsaeliensis TaxID=2992142 RepID=UPI00254B8988|nr:class I SAM-dependent methyltransferase [Amycolatopsis sp. RTGN1]
MSITEASSGAGLPQRPYDRLYLSRAGLPLWGDSPGRLVGGLSYQGQSKIALDAGCGDGKNAIHLERLGFDVIGIDHSDVAIKLLHERFHSNGRPVLGSYSVADVRTWRPVGLEVDVLVSYGLYHCLPQNDRATHEHLLNLIRPGGTLLFCSLTDGVPMGDEHCTPGIELPSVKEVDEHLQGFTILERSVEKFDGSHPPLVGPHRHEAIWISARRPT